MRFKRRDRSEWRRWFAWRPVRTENGEWVWLEWVEREFCRHGFVRGFGPFEHEIETWAYRLPDPDARLTAPERWPGPPRPKGSA